MGKATSSKEVSEALMIPKSIVNARASGYRALGIKLKKMRRGPKKLDVEGLNKLIEGLRPETERTEDGGSFAF